MRNIQATDMLNFHHLNSSKSWTCHSVNQGVLSTQKKNRSYQRAQSTEANSSLFQE